MNFPLPPALMLGLFVCPAFAQHSPSAPSSQATRGDAQLTEYLQAQSAEIANNCLNDVTRDDWAMLRKAYQDQLKEMLGLSPMPDRTPLNAVVTGTLETEEFTVEKLYFQASPQLYCTANLYLPKGVEWPAPTVLYECGHWKYITNGVSYGNKAVYQIDGAWYARNGYVCLVLDTLLAGEIQGMHTGTRDNGLWWWNSRGYTPAGVEAWFGIRALDYLCSRPEVDADRIGITGHSGGGAYSWTVSALDDRIKVAAPLAGMTDLQHHILDNLMDSHCDCNFPINIYRWDFPQLAAIGAPRPLLIGGTDNDRIFPLDATVAIHDQVKGVYALLEKTDRLGLVIAPGPHDEVPELRLAVIRWFNRFLKGVERESEPPIHIEYKRFFAPEELRVFKSLPEDAINAVIAETFVPMASRQSRSADELRPLLLEQVFAGWPTNQPPLQARETFAAQTDNIRLQAWDFESQSHVPLRLYLLTDSTKPSPGNVLLEVFDGAGWTNWLANVGAAFPNALAFELSATRPDQLNPDGFAALKRKLTESGSALAVLAPRGIGLDVWSGDTKRQTRIRRRFMLLGQTLDGMRVWDIRRAVQLLRSLPDKPFQQVEIEAEGEMGVNTLYASLFEPKVTTLTLRELPSSHTEGPDYLNVLKVTDIPGVRAAVSAQTSLTIE